MEKESVLQLTQTLIKVKDQTVTEDEVSFLKRPEN